MALTKVSRGLLSGQSTKNLIINGAMQVAQRYGVSSPQTNWNGYYADRWYKRTNGSAPSSVDTVADAPSGFTNSYKSIIGTASADTSISVAQLIESVNTTQLHYGLSSAKTVTVSFWVKASIAGTYCVAVQNPTTSIADDSTRSYLAEYTISAVNTWEYKTITISGDTTGTWNVVSVRWQISKSTSTYQGVLGWQSGELRHTSNQTDQGATSGATFQLTGVQLELGSVATPFEHRSYGEELALCQRYYQKFFDETSCTAQVQLTGIASGAGHFVWWPPVQMRARPTVGITTTTPYWESMPWYAVGTSLTVSSISNGHMSRSGGEIAIYGSYNPALTRGTNYTITGEVLYWDAEL